jgi:hypothetical protein
LVVAPGRYTIRRSSCLPDATLAHQPQVLSAMQSWRHESLFADLIAEEDTLARAFRAPTPAPINYSERAAILQNTFYSLQRLQMGLVGHDLELSWVNQLLAYVQQLQNLNPAQTPEEQFNYLYQLRKWLFWIPISLLQREGGQGPAIMTIAHFYAAAISLEPLFPELGSSFVSAMALPPLESILSVTDAMQSEHGPNASSMEIAAFMQFPRQTAMAYRNLVMQQQQPSAVQPQQQQQQHHHIKQENRMLPVDPETLSYTSIGNISPAFTPTTPQYHMQPPPTSSSTPSAYLEVPSTQSFAYGTQTWGAMPSPSFPPQQYPEPQGQMDLYGGFRGGFVPAPTVWT